MPMSWKDFRWPMLQRSYLATKTDDIILSQKENRSIDANGDNLMLYDTNLNERKNSKQI